MGRQIGIEQSAAVVAAHDATGEHAAAVLGYCAESGILPAIVVFHETLVPATMEQLLASDGVAGIVAPGELAGRDAATAARIGRYVAADYAWQLPDVEARCVAMFGPRSCITFRMARAVLRAGIPWLVYVTLTGWRRERTLKFIALKFVEKGTAMLGSAERKMMTRLRETGSRLPARATLLNIGQVLRTRARQFASTRFRGLGIWRVLPPRRKRRSGLAGRLGDPILRRYALDLSTVVPMSEEGLAFIVSAPDLAAESDNMHHPRRSRWILMEDDRSLMYPHALHEEIRTLGLGRWSHWGHSIYFSSTDGTDPRTNGRSYELVCSERIVSPLRALLRWRNPFEDLLSAADDCRFPPETFQPNRILLVNSSLCSGGAERQVVNTLLGLKKRGYTDIGVLCEHLHDRPAHDFYLWMLEQEGIRAWQIDRAPRAAVDLVAGAQFSPVAQLIAGLPLNLRDEVFVFVHELLRFRPQVVHAWQDQTSIKVGIAAALVGIPCIVLGSRNLPPYHFHYYLSYMAPAYRALANQETVVFTNNSRPGARDYERWLGLPPDTFQVVYNGIDTARISRVTPEQAAAYKAHLGIPAEARVVGGIFRLYPEKDPQLWVKTARRILDANPDVYFLIVGIGILEAQIEQLASSLDLQDRLVMPGTEKQAALPLSIMDVFLLTSKQEGTPNVVIEAQMLGVPVVATNAGGTIDALIEGETGFIVRKRRASALAAKVDWCLQNTEWRRSAAERAPEFAGQRFGFDSMIDNTLNSYGLPGDCPDSGDSRQD